MNQALRHHRGFYPVNMQGCMLHLPFYRYGSNQSKVWDQSGHQNHGTITGAVPFPGNPILTSSGSTYNYGDFTATNAFLWSSIDLSPYAGTDSGSTPYYIDVVDGAGKHATGYLGAVGAGETLGSEEFADPSFDNTASWIKETGEWTVSGGQGHAAAASANSNLYQTLSPIANALFKAVLICSSIASGTYRIFAGGAVNTNSPTYTDTGTKTYYVTRVSGGIHSIQVVSTLTAVFDSLSYKRVTDCPATAVHIVSSLNGTTRDWASIESGFDPNTITSWVISKVVTDTLIGWHFDGIDDKISVTALSNLITASAGTIIFWVRCGSSPRTAVSAVVLPGIFADEEEGYVYITYGITGGLDRLWFQNYAAGQQIVGIPYSADRWMQLAWVHLGGVLYAYQNGVLIDSVVSGDTGALNTSFSIGRNYNGSSFFRGQVGEFSIFSRGLSALEVKVHFELTRHIYGV